MMIVVFGAWRVNTGSYVTTTYLCIEIKKLYMVLCEVEDTAFPFQGGELNRRRMCVSCEYAGGNDPNW